MGNFIDTYLKYVGDTECPITFHRWSALSIVGALLGRRFHFTLGHSRVNSNLYVMLMGGPGTRKTTAIKIATSVLKEAGYDKIAADKTSKEKLLLDMAGAGDQEGDILEQNLFGGASGDDAEIMIAADEFNIFVGNGNIEFLSMLGVLWDYDGTFKSRLKNSTSLEVENPTVSILAGNTPTGFSLAFPAEAIGQGIFSRLLLVHGESTGKKIAFPRPPSQEAKAEIAKSLAEIRYAAAGESSLSVEAQDMLEFIYKGWRGVGDVRFETYGNRRFVHLLKLCLITAAANYRSEIRARDVVTANTVLAHAEHTMPKALGEFGKSRYSDVTHKIMSLLDSAAEPVTFKRVWQNVHNDLEGLDKLQEILRSLIAADKVITTKHGYLVRRAMIEERPDVAGTLDFQLLTHEERRYLG